MGITIGDALAVVGLVFGVCGSLWALVLGTSLLFPSRAAAAQVALERPWKSFLWGLLVAATLGVLAIGLMAAPNPLAKVLGMGLLGSLLAISAIGGAGVVHAAAGRIRELDPESSAFSSLARGSGILVLSGLVPFLGWFGIAPIALLVSLGAGIKGVFRRSARTAPAPAETGTAWQ